MKAGDKVTISEYSWVRSVSHGKLNHERPNCCDDADRQYTIVETGCSFPLVGRYNSQWSKYRNNTVIQADDGRVVFIHSGFLKLVDPPHVWVDGDIGRRDEELIILAHCTCSPLQHYIVIVGDDAGSYELWEDHIDPLCTTFLFNIKDKL